MLTDQQLENWFSYHAPKVDQAQRYEALRSAGLAMARIIRDLTPASADQTAAIEQVRLAVMWANAAIACEGK